MNNNRGGVFIILMIVAALVAFWFEYYVSGGKPFDFTAHPSNNQRSYLTYEEHLARQEREKRVADAQGKASNFLQDFVKKAKPN